MVSLASYKRSPRASSSYSPAITARLRSCMKRAFRRSISNTPRRDTPVIAINLTDPGAYPDDTYEKMVSYAKERNYSVPVSR